MTLFGQLCPPPPLSTSSSTKPSPSFSPASFPSPADPSLGSSRTGATAEREKHLHQTGLPHTLSGQAPICARTQDDLTQVMVHLRKMQLARSKGVDEARPAKRVRPERWIGGGEGVAKMARGDDGERVREIGPDGEEVKRTSVSTRYQF